MDSSAKTTKRPVAVTLIALFQGALAAYCLYFLILACADPPENLGFLRSALRLLFGRTDYHSYVSSRHEDLVMGFLLYSGGAGALIAFGAITGWGLWTLKKWARHSVVSEYGTMAVLWARSFLFFGVGGGFSHVPASALEPIYVAVYVETMICLTLLFHGGVAEAFGEAK